MNANYIIVIDGKYTGSQGYIKKMNGLKFLCVIWHEGKQIETTLDKSQYKTLL